MKNSCKNLVMLCVVFTAFSCRVLSQGRDVMIYFKDGSSKSGELLSVRDSVVSILKSSIEDIEELVAHPEIVEIALLKDVDKIWLGKYEASGAAVGALIGTGAGVIADAATISGYEGTARLLHFGRQ